jgi:hypothetical protein
MTPFSSPHCARAYTPLYVGLSQQSASDAHLKAVRNGKAQQVPTGEPLT